MAKRTIKSGGRKSSSSKSRRSIGSGRRSAPRTKIKSGGFGGSKRKKSPATSPISRSSRGSSQNRRRLTRRNVSPFPGLPKAPNRVGGGMVGIPRGFDSDTAIDYQMRADQVRRQFASLESRAQLSGIYKAIGHLDSRLTALPLELDGLRRRRYVHAGQLEDKIVALDERWESVRPRIDQTLKHHVGLLNGDLDQARRMMGGLGRGVAGISAASAALSGLSAKIDAAQSAVSGLYSGLDDQIDDIDEAMNRVDWMLDHFEAAQFELRETEAPIAAAAAEWDQDGDKGPDGILYLTDQRLLFEQKEHIATKKILGIITTKKEEVHDFLFDVEISNIERVTESEEKKGFLNTEREEILELILSPKAQLSRARFELLDQDSEAWGALLKRVINGEIDEDRAEEFLAEVDQAEMLAAGFPENCPNCMAKLPAVHRGATSVTCEYCDSVVTPEAPAEKSSPKSINEV